MENKIEWKPEVYELFNKIVVQVPEMFRPMVKPLLHETAVKKCLDRNASQTNEADLVTALLEITPGPFKTEAIDNLKSLGIDVQRYIKLKEIRDQHNLSWNQFGKAFYPRNYHFTMYLTDRCNQKCIHCASETRKIRPELSTEQWKHIIENIETSLMKQGRHGVYIWFGGEPTLRGDIRELIKYCGDREYFQAVATNGMLFTEDFAKYCADNGMSHVFVSLDSADPEKAAKIRGVPRAFESAERAIKTAVNHGLFTIVTATVMKLNMDELEKTRSLIQSWGAIPYFRAVIKQSKAAENWDEIGLNREDYKKLYDFKYKPTIEAIREGDLPGFLIYDMVPFIEKPQNDKELTALEWGVGCQACRSVSGIDTNGDFFPCDYSSKLTIGNVLTQNFEDIMNSQLFKDIRDRKRTGKCGSCHHLDLCGGGCRVHAERETGDFFASFSYCWHEDDHKHDISNVLNINEVRG